ncbi:MAG TPA: DUF47 family protein [Blastocatellia bacterium]|nr:DUF47 family protein [Blastocatellia bacterium]
MLRIIPKEEKYFELFNQMASQIIEGAALLKRLFEDFGNYTQYADQIKQVEHKCDEITHDIVRRLNQTFITPIDREDIHSLSGKLDDIIDDIDYVARRTVLYHIDAPTTYAVQLSDILVKLGAKIQSAVSQLGKGYKGVLDDCISIHDLENKGDAIHHAAVEELFRIEKDPIKVLKWKELYEKLERSIDRCEDAANVLEAIVLKNA